MKIIPAREDHIDRILELINYGVSQKTVLKRSKEDIQDCLNSFLLAIEDKKVIGCIALDLYKRMDNSLRQHSIKFAEIRSLVVDPKYQGRGVATALIKQCYDLCRVFDIYELMVTTVNPQLFYDFGFRSDEVGKFVLWIKPKIGRDS